MCIFCFFLDIVFFEGFLGFKGGYLIFLKVIVYKNVVKLCVGFYRFYINVFMCDCWCVNIYFINVDFFKMNLFSFLDFVEC